MTSVLFTPEESGLMLGSRHWCITKDGDPLAFAIYRRHYSARKNPRPKHRQFVGPGEPLVLIGRDGDALFVWRKFIDDSGQQGVNCACFRNEGPSLSSELIREACLLAWAKWPGERLYTYVNRFATASRRGKGHLPGHCFRKAGWSSCGHTKGGLVILEILP